MHSLQFNNSKISPFSAKIMVKFALLWPTMGVCVNDVAYILNARKIEVINL